MSAMPERVGRGLVLVPILLLTWTACAGRSPEASDTETPAERPARVETLWTDAHEWFVEHPLLLRGEAAELAAHLTSLGTFRPVVTGELEVALVDGAGRVLQSVVAESVARPGIFLPELTPERAGSARLRLTYTGPSGAVDRVGWDVDVVATPEELGTAGPAPEGIAFLKEQQWRIPFATVAVGRALLREVVELPATIEAHPRGTAVVAAPSAGIYRAPAGGLPNPGAVVAGGQVLGELVPSPGDSEGWHTARAELVAARNRVSAAEREEGRAERLVRAGAVPERRLSEARAALEDARARLSAVRARASSLGAEDAGAADRLPLRAPIGGVVAEVDVSEGEPVDPDRALFRIVDLDRLVARVEVPEPELQHLLAARTASEPIELALRPGSAAMRTAERAVDGAWIEGGRLLELGTVVDPGSRTAPVRYELRGAGDRLRPGMSAVAQLGLGSPRQAVAVPAEAIIDLAGVQVVYVQLGGETFEERVVRTGIRDRDLIEIASGLEPGDRLVTRGAYEVRLASLSPDAAPAHSH